MGYDLFYGAASSKRRGAPGGGMADVTQAIALFGAVAEDDYR